MGKKEKVFTWKIRNSKDKIETIKIDMSKIDAKKMPNVIKGKEWKSYMEENDLLRKKQEEIYVCTHNYTPIYKLNDYYFSFNILRGYKNLSALKRLL